MWRIFGSHHHKAGTPTDLPQSQMEEYMEKLLLSPKRPPRYSEWVDPASMT
jgi:hypothetical protein